MIESDCRLSKDRTCQRIQQLEMGPDCVAQMPTTPAFVNTDVTGVRQEYLFRPPRCIDNWLVGQLKDKRDAPMVYLLFNICTVSIPLAVCLYLVPNVPHWAGFLVLVLNIVLFMERFILCLHYSEHVQIFKDTRIGSVLSLICPWFLVSLFGIPPGVYRLHHLVMHHCENNLWSWDASSTERYQRDNLLHFLCYWMRFLFAIAVELPLYAISRKRYGLAAQAIASGILEYVIARQLWALSPVATTWVVTAPLIFTSFALMFGNWSQHMFVDPLRSRNNYALTYNLVNTEVNMKTFNDGYHIIHHSNSKLHWSELPNAFMTSLDKHAREDALIFEGLSFSDVGVYVFAGRLGALAERYVNIGQPQRSKDELVAVLRSRLMPVPVATGSKLKNGN